MGDNVLSQEEIDKLLNSIESEGTSYNKPNILQKNVKKYDFKRPQKFTKDHMKSLSIIHENFTQYLSSYFVSVFGVQVKIEIMSTEQITFHEFVFSMPNPTTIISFEMPPLFGNIFMGLESSLSVLLLNSLLGSNDRKNLGIMREFSDIDKKILTQVSNEILNIIRVSWDDIISVEPKFVNLETNPSTVQSMGPNEPILFVTFKIEIEGAAYFMYICLPYISIEKIGDKLNRDYLVKTNTEEEVEIIKKSIRKELNSVNIELEAILDRKFISIQDFLSLQPNDIIILNKKCNSPVEIYIEERLIFNGVLGLVGENKGVKILDIYYSEEVMKNGEGKSKSE
ncbi:flagellar motor switch protein FliM [Candidatus Arthromitus sp. SFB-rat-Yit]|uniref:flagellar motor switch protein FliM n=1 Tax=Candidatus Arthromitus sp. SFB-rat-Yit TaxID=1041504 RepID=UPI000227A5D2|nr:flagellar motor switch protein FliM [Candidatus Arthromitus sp. SFB-rat-Yit]BAK81036.1 flagellar motor switch protein FliM [Candidatus Arthromitus sp. SFB-rat-Yit]